MIFHYSFQNDGVILKIDSSNFVEKTNETLVCGTIAEIFVDFGSSLIVDSPPSTKISAEHNTPL